MRNVVLAACAAAGIFATAYGEARAVAHAAAPMPAPTARPATANEMRAFMALAPAPPPKGRWTIDEHAVAGSYALVGYYNEHAGLTALLQRKAGRWAIVKRTGGQLTPDALRRYAPAMPLATAQSLYKLAVSQDKGNATKPSVGDVMNPQYMYMTSHFMIAPEDVARVTSVQARGDVIQLRLRYGACITWSHPHHDLTEYVKGATRETFHTGELVATSAIERNGEAVAVIRSVGPSEAHAMRCAQRS